MRSSKWTYWLLAVLAIYAGGISAADYPTKLIRIIVAYPAGAGTDPIARLVAQKLSEAWGQPVVVENRAGASGMIGADYVAKATSDGYTLLMAYTSEVAVNVSLYPKISYDSRKDFAPVILATVMPMVLVVHPSLPVKNVKELIALAKLKPGQLMYAAVGIGSPAQLVFELLQRNTGTKMMHVPYKGAAPLMTDLLGGHVAMFFASVQVALPYITSGRLRAIAMSTGKRSPVLPDVPTLNEVGIKGFDISTWYGLLAPAGTPKEVVAMLNGEISRALAQRDVKDWLARQGLESPANTPEQFREFLLAEIEKFARMIKESGVRVE